MGENDIRPRYHACTTKPGDCPAGDEPGTVRGHRWTSIRILSSSTRRGQKGNRRTTPEGSQLKAEDCSDKGVLDGAISVKLAPKRLEDTHGQEESGAIPTHIV